jgi:type II secretory pathway component HofQ
VCGPVFAGSASDREKMNLNFKNANLVDVLEIVAKITKMNIVVDPGVKGIVTCNLKQVPWDKALKKILEPNGLDMSIKGNVLRIFKAIPANQKWKKSVTQKKYSGEPMDLSFKYVELSNVLKIIAKRANKKILMPVGIKGNVDCHLEKVPWDQAMDLILQLNGLEMKVEGDLIKVFKPGK